MRRGPTGAAVLLALYAFASPVGVAAQDDDGAGPTVRAAEGVWTDAWGQPKNFGLAALETYMGNFLPWVFNELVPSRASLLISQISPRSWWRNIEQGWEWDDNAFQVNLFAHPFQGGIYYNSARSNGYSYWTGLAFALAGSFHWECCGETHFMSLNDWVNTSVGGAAVGETLYRASSMILDNQARGAERIARESAAFLMAPTRGFTRLITGNAGRVYENPVHPSDHVPDELEMALSVGVRRGPSWREGRGGRLDEDLPGHGFIDLELVAGDLTELDRQKPFDYVIADAQINLVRGRGLGELSIHGSLWHMDIARSERGVSKLVAMQDFEYENNSVFEQGGQGVSLLYLRDMALSDRSALTFSLGPGWMLLGGVRSELAFLAEVEGIRERFREYDFGIGPAGRLGAEWRFDGRQILQGSYRLQYLSTLNGSTFEGEGSDHLLQILRAKAVLPVSAWGLTAGVEYEHFRRTSDFQIGEIGEVRQRTQVWQIYLSYNPLRDVQ